MNNITRRFPLSNISFGETLLNGNLMDPLLIERHLVSFFEVIIYFLYSKHRLVRI